MVVFHKISVSNRYLLMEQIVALQSLLVFHTTTTTTTTTTDNDNSNTDANNNNNDNNNNNNNSNNIYIIKIIHL